MTFGYIFDNNCSIRMGEEDSSVFLNLTREPASKLQDARLGFLARSSAQNPLPIQPRESFD